MCQQAIKSLPGEKLIAANIKILSGKADTSDNKAGFTEEYIFLDKEDTVSVYDKIRTSIIGTAEEYIGVPYRYGQSSEKGFDCSGFVKYIYGRFGLDLPHSSIDQYKMSKHLALSEVQPGDLVFFMTRNRSISHVGIYLGDNQFIHSPSRGKYVSIDSLGAEYYKRHFIGFGTVLNLPVYKRFIAPATIITHYMKQKISFPLPSLISSELVKRFNHQFDITGQI
jgi:hypothetical protein